MLDAILWGLIQGLTEFLPISSSGHAVLIPALLGTEGPDPATSAMIHLGTLAAVLLYFRADIGRMAGLDRPGRKLITLIVLGTIPAAVIGSTLGNQIDRARESPKAVAVLLVVTGIILLGTMLLRFGDRTVEALRPADSCVVGFAQALALIPGISRTGLTISSSLARGLQRLEAARFAYLLGIPVIAWSSLSSMLELMAGDGGIPAGAWVGAVASAASGYAAIGLLMWVLARVGLAPFGIYCVVAGTLSFILL